MITHIVCFKLKDRSAENIEKCSKLLADMNGKVEMLRYIEVGTDILHSERSYDIALVTKFDSLKDLDAYQVDPVHAEVKKVLGPASESIISVDYET